MRCILAIDSGGSKCDAILGEYAVLLRKAIRRCAPAHTALDLADIEQEARIRVWHALQRETTITHPASYLYRTAVSATIDAIRRAKARREEQLDGAEMTDGAARHWQAATSEWSPEQMVERREAARMIRDAITTLSADRRRAVGLHLQGFTSQEIAGLTGWTEARARNLASRGMGDLRRTLAERGCDVAAD